MFACKIVEYCEQKSVLVGTQRCRALVALSLWVASSYRLKSMVFRRVDGVDREQQLHHTMYEKSKNDEMCEKIQKKSSAPHLGAPSGGPLNCK